MKGGYFDYKEFVLSDIADQITDLVIKNNIPDEWGYTNDFSDKTLNRFRETVDVLLRAVSMIREIDYLVSRNEKEEMFNEKWESEITTHHPACDCREEKMLLICMQLMKEHNELKKFMAGFGKAEMCHCPACEAAMNLYGEKALLEEKDDT